MLRLLVGLFLLCAASPIYALVLGFDDPPLPTGHRSETYYAASGFEVTGAFGHAGRETSALASSNSSLGTLKILHGGQALITHRDGLAFRVISVDLSEYSTLFSYPIDITFYGVSKLGAFIEHTFTTDGIIDGPGGGEDFQKFAFPTTFNHLISLSTQRAQITNPQLPRVEGFAFDNLELMTIPEPGSAWLMIAALMVLLHQRCTH